MAGIKYINSTKPKIELPAYRGRTYELMAPDTLDLQDMAGLGVNGLTGPALLRSSSLAFRPGAFFE